MELKEISKKMYEDGIKDENFVMKLTEKIFKCKTYKSSKYKDISSHIDFWCEVNNKKYGIDVKGLRKNKRTDNDYDDTIQWVELKNVQGKKGWLYGDACYITFMTNKSILYCSRKKLVNLIEEKIKDKETVYHIPDKYYIPYQRKKRLDKIVKVPTEDIRCISKYEIILYCDII